MKMYFFIISVLVVASVYYFISFNGKTNRNKQSQTSENSYIDLRQLAFNTPVEKIQSLVPTNPNKVNGVIMDWDLGNGTMTLATFESGDANIYLSSGGGIIGGGTHENVNRSVKDFVKLVQAYLTKAELTDTI